MVNINTDIWHWYHNVSECYYHIQITVKYRESLLSKKFEGVILESIGGVEERYAIEVSHVGFDQNNIHLLMTFLPKYSGGHVISLLKSISVKAIFREIPEVKAELWGGEFGTDGYYISTISGKGNKAVIEKYIQNQGREKDIKQLKLFEI